MEKKVSTEINQQISKILQKGDKRKASSIKKEKETKTVNRTFKQILLAKLNSKDPETGKPYKDSIMDALIDKAKGGDQKSIEYLLKVAEEQPKERQEIEITTPTKINVSFTSSLE